MFSKVQFSKKDSVKNPDAKLPLDVHWLFLKRENQKVESIRVLSANHPRIFYQLPADSVYSADPV